MSEKTELSNEQKMIKNFGALQYPSSIIASILNRNEDEISKQMIDENSELYKLYKSGKDYSEYCIDLKLLELAHSGDIKAIDKLEERKRKRR